MKDYAGTHLELDPPKPQQISILEAECWKTMERNIARHLRDSECVTYK